MTELKITYKNIDELIEYINNPRKNLSAVAHVKASIKEFGFNVPIILNSENVIIAGHTRIMAARELGMTTVPCIMIDDLTPSQVKAFRIADNKTSENAEWDIDMLKIELENLDDIFTGFSNEELDKLLAVETAEAEEDDYDGAIQDEPTTKKGDIYQLGEHRVMCGDSTKIGDIEMLMDGARVDLFITDPPYNVGYVGKTQDKLTIKNDNLGDAEYRRFLTDAFTMADMVMNPGASYYIWHADTEGYNVRGACGDVGWEVREILIWVKNALVMGRQDYQWQHEPCLYGWKAGRAHLWNNDRKQTTILNFDKPTKSTEHPTMKPIKLFDYLIKNNTHSGHVVLDLFAGSGTTTLACEQNGRVSYCMEMEPKYVDVIIKRWEKLTNKSAVLLNKGELHD